MKQFFVLLGITLSAPAIAVAGPEDFVSGPVIADFGDIALLEDSRLGPSSEFKIAFDLAAAGEPGQANRRIETAARFLNMHGAAGVPLENMQLALIVHGGAHKDLLKNEKYGGENANAPLIAALIDAGVRIDLCGQTAVHYGITKDDLLPGVIMSLSAMTSHALLQQEGYTLNPF